MRGSILDLLGGGGMVMILLTDHDDNNYIHGKLYIPAWSLVFSLLKISRFYRSFGKGFTDQRIIPP